MLLSKLIPHLSTIYLSANFNGDIKVEVTDADLVDSSLDPVSGL